MLTDDEFYAAVLPHVRAKRAGHVEEVTPKDASATRSNGEKHPERVTESVGPNGPKLSIIVRSEGSAVPESQRASHYRPRDKKRSRQGEGWAWPVVEPDMTSPVDGLVITIGMLEADKVKISDVKTYRRPDYQAGRPGDTVAFVLQSLKTPTTSYIITFDGTSTRDGSFETLDPQLNDLAGNWMVRWMFRTKHGR